MEKKFDEWNNRKKVIDSTDTSADFHEREIWWCYQGFVVNLKKTNSVSTEFSEAEANV